MTCGTPKSFKGMLKGDLQQKSGFVIPLLLLNPAIAKSSDNSPFKMLSDRAISSDSKVYNPGMLYEDVLYPKYFNGMWKCESTTASVSAPLGIDAFGGPSAWESAQKDIGNTLKYQSRFITRPDGEVVADRLFNVKTIADKAMGKGAVLVIEGDRGILKGISSNTIAYFDGLAAKINVAITPDQTTGDIFDVSLVTSDRNYGSDEGSNAEAGAFAVVERVTQSISRRMDLLSSQPPPPRVKEIETISFYSVPNSDRTVVQAVQRTATFLSPQEQSVSYRSLVAKDGRIANEAVDIRTYNLTYIREG